MAMNKTPEKDKSVDLPPKGSRNADPITDAPGSHPIETGVGAALGGAATGAAIGTVAGPIGTALGAAAGAIAGGYAGKGVGELIDPTTEDNWLRENFSSRPYVQEGETIDTYRPAYTYGGYVEDQHAGKRFSDIEGDLKAGWEKTEHGAKMAWDRAKGAVKDAFDYRSAHRYGADAHERHTGRPYEEIESDLSEGWEKTRDTAGRTWDEARCAVKDAYDRKCRLRDENLTIDRSAPDHPGHKDVTPPRKA